MMAAMPLYVRSGVAALRLKFAKEWDPRVVNEWERNEENDDALEG